MPSAEGEQYDTEEQLDEGAKSEAPETNPDLKFEDAIKMYNDAKTYVDNGPRKRWDKYYKVYKGERVIRNYDGISDPRTREPHTIIETLVANIAGGNPKFHFVQTNENQAADTEILNEMLDYYMKCNQMDLKNQEWVRDMLMYGTGVIHIGWRDGKPYIINIALRDFFVDPTSTGLVNTKNPARYAGFEYLQDRKVLEREKVFDAKTGTYVNKYSSEQLKKLGPSPDGNSGSETGSMDKAFKDMFNSSTLGDEAAKQQIHVIVLYDLLSGKVVEMGNKKEIIYQADTWAQRPEEVKQVIIQGEPGPNGEPAPSITVEKKLDAIKPFLPFAILRDYIDSSLFYGEGELAEIMDDAELLNDYEAMDIDNNAYQNTPMYWVDPQFSDLIPEIETIPGAVYPIPRNAMGTIERPQFGGDLDAKKERILQRMRRATAADEVVQGVSQDKGRVTATEVSSTLTQAQNRFSTKISNLESEGYAQLGSTVFKCIQIFVTRKKAVRIVGKRGVAFKDYDPWEYNGEYEPHVQLDTTIKRNQVEVGLKDQAIFESMKNNTLFNQVELTRWWVQKKDPSMTDDEFNKLLAPPAPPVDDSKDFLNIAYKDLEPWGKIQAQKEMGWEPDPALQAEIQLGMLEQANRANDLQDPVTQADGSLVPGMEDLVNPTPQTPPAEATLTPAMA